MKLISSIVIAGIATGAMAQFGQYGKPQRTGAEGKEMQGFYVGAGYASFTFSATGVSITRSGALLLLDKTFFPNDVNNQTATTIGGWYWTGANKLYELHARHQFTDMIGGQIGLVKTPDANQTDFDVFATFRKQLNENASASQSDQAAIFGTAGLGAYIFDRSVGSRVQPTGFIQLAAEFPQGFGIELSYWLIRDTKFSVNIGRLAATGSYRF